MKSNKINELDVLPFVDAEERITFGSYGTIFMDDSQRLDSDINIILKRNEEAGIRSNIHTPCIDDEKSLQRLGKHYNKGVNTDFDEIRRKIEKGERETKGDFLYNSYNDVVGPRKKYKSPPNPLNIIRSQELMVLDSKREGGKYYVNKYNTDHHEDPIVMKASNSTYNLNTPKAWPVQTQYTRYHYHHRHHHHHYYYYHHHDLL